MEQWNCLRARGAPRDCVTGLNIRRIERTDINLIHFKWGSRVNRHSLESFHLNVLKPVSLRKSELRFVHALLVWSERIEVQRFMEWTTCASFFFPPVRKNTASNRKYSPLTPLASFSVGSTRLHSAPLGSARPGPTRLGFQPEMTSVRLSSVSSRVKKPRVSRPLVHCLAYLWLSEDRPPGDTDRGVDVVVEVTDVADTADTPDAADDGDPCSTEPRPRWIRSVSLCSSKRAPNALRDPLVVRKPCEKTSLFPVRMIHLFWEFLPVLGIGLEK